MPTLHDSLGAFLWSWSSWSTDHPKPEFVVTMVGRIITSCVSNHKNETDRTEGNRLVEGEMDPVEDEDNSVECADEEDCGTGEWERRKKPCQKPSTFFCIITLCFCTPVFMCARWCEWMWWWWCAAKWWVTRMKHVENHQCRFSFQPFCHCEFQPFSSHTHAFLCKKSTAGHSL